MSERRAFPRVKKRLEVRFAVNGARQTGVTSDVSVTGLYIVAEVVPRVGEKLVVDVTSSLGEVLHLSGRVASSDLGTPREGSSLTGFAFALEAYNEGYERLVSSVSLRSGFFPRPRRRSETGTSAASGGRASAAALPAIEDAVEEAVAAPLSEVEAVRILLIDPSERSHQRLLDAVARREDFTLERIASPAEGLLALKEKRHDVAVVSWRLGSGGGLEMIRHAIAAGCEAPLILLTNIPDDELELRAIREGAADAVDLAGLDPARFERAVRHAITRARARRAPPAGDAGSDRELDDLYENAPCGCMTLDSSGLILRMNATFLAWLGYARSELVGTRRFTELLEPGSVPAYHERARWFLERGRLRDMEIDLRRKNGSFLPVSAYASVAAPPGHPPFSRWILLDSTDRREREAALRRQARAIETIDVGVTIRDLFGTLLYANPAAAAMHGYAVEELIGHDAGMLAAEETRVEMSQVPPAAASHLRWDGAGLRKDGSRFPARLATSVLVDELGAPVALVTSVEDLSAAEQARRTREEATRGTRARLVEQLRDVDETLEKLNGLLRPSAVSD